MNMIKVVIVEDEEEEAKRLTDCLNRFAKEKGIEISISRFSNGLDFIDNYKPIYDIIFMDIRMPLMNGLSASKRLRILDTKTLLIFITNMAQYAINGYEVNAFDYIIKPIDYSAFEYRFENAVRALRTDRNPSLLIKNKKGLIKIDVDSIYYIDVEKHKVTFHTDQGDIEEWSSMNDVEDRLKQCAPGRFSRCNNCFLVNLFHFDRIEGDTLFVHDIPLKISRNRNKPFLNDLNAFLSDWK